MGNHSADADNGLNEQLVLQRVLHVDGDLFQIFCRSRIAQLLYNGNIRFVDAYHEILQLIGEQAGQHVHSGHIAMTNLPHQEHHTGRIGCKMQFLCPNVNITGQDIIHNNILNEGATVVLFLVVALCIIQRDMYHIAKQLRLLVITGAKRSILKHTGAVENCAEGLLCKGNCLLAGAVYLNGSIRPPLTQQRNICAGYHTALTVNHTKQPVRHIIQLLNDSLKNTIGHFLRLP